MRKREVPALDVWVMDTHGPLDDPISHSLEDTVLDALDDLEEERWRTILQMRFYEQLTYDEIATEFGWVDENGKPKRQLAHYYVKQAQNALRSILEERTNYGEDRD